MESSTSTITATAMIATFFLLLLPSFYAAEILTNRKSSSLPRSDVDLLEFPLNLEYLEAEFFLWGSLGRGLDRIAPNLTQGGPPPIGAKAAKLDPLTRDIIVQFAFQEVGHLRFIFIIIVIIAYINVDIYNNQ